MHRALYLLASAACVLVSGGCGKTRVDDSKQANGAPAPAWNGKRIFAGGGRSCSLDRDGHATCWGNLLDGMFNPPAERFVELTVGGDFVCGLRSDRTPVCWGFGKHGSMNSALDPPPGRYREISAGSGYGCGILEDTAKLVCWGLPDYGLTDPPDGRFKTVAAGSAHACALREDATATCWGSSLGGRTDAPGGQFERIYAGEGSCAIDADGRVTCWGFAASASGQSALGLDVASGACLIRPDKTLACFDPLEPSVRTPPGGRFEMVAVGSHHACAVRSDDTIACWGRNNYGQSTPPP